MCLLGVTLPILGVTVRFPDVTQPILGVAVRFPDVTLPFLGVAVRFPDVTQPFLGVAVCLFGVDQKPATNIPNNPAFIPFFERIL